ncbi:MAG: DNA-protecting protein DprA [Planctomycetes bacterium]|nr:DNA-protecting protein DprA [Planctomycetota bacterium]
MELTAEERDLLTLHLVPGIGPRLSAALLRKFGSAAKVLKAGSEALQTIPHLGPQIAERLRESLASRNVDEELAEIARFGVSLLCHDRPGYPQVLTTLAVPPRFLYVRGNLLESDAKSVAIVGSRSCTSYGRRVAEKLALDLAHAGFTVISGLARGIDVCAHRGALQAKGRTIAVLAGGLSKIYPPEHAEVAEQIVAAGALISESAMRMEPMAGMFPARNRIISGLARAVVLVEAAEKSGALITARHAVEQGREVFCIPGPVDSLASGGTLKLLRDGAKLIRNADDLLEDLGGIAPLIGVPPGGRAKEPESITAAGPPMELDETQRSIWEFLSEGRTVDDLARHISQSISVLSGMLMTLELKKVIRRLPGNMYERY